MTVAGAVGLAAKSSRIRSANGSSCEPAGARLYRGGSRSESSRSTVFRLMPSRRAIAAFDAASR